MVWKPSTLWTANSTSPRADQSYQNGDRPEASYPVYADSDIFASASALGGGDGTIGNPYTLAEGLAVVGTGGNYQLGVAAGIYIGSDPGAPVSEESYTPAFQPSNSGTQANKIKIVAENPAVSNSVNRTEIYSGATVSQQGWPAIGDYGRSHIEWYGIYLDETHAQGKSAEDSAPYYSRGESGAHINGCGIFSSEIVGETILIVNNQSGIRFEYSDNFSEANNRIHGFNSFVNSSGIITYKSNNADLGNGEIYNCFNGVQPKGADGAATIYALDIHHKVIRDCQNMFRFHGPVEGPSGEISKVRNCIGYNNSFISEFTGSSHSGEQDGLYFFNCTFDDVTGNDPAAMWLAADHDYENEGVIPRNNRFFNCIIGSSASFWGVYRSDVDLAWFKNFMTCDYNALNLTIGIINASAGAGLDGTTEVQWQSAGQDINSVFEATTFEDKLNRDYHLPDGSPRLTQGSDLLGQYGPIDAVIPLGAYVTGNETIGVTP